MADAKPRNPAQGITEPGRPIIIGWREYVSLPEWNVSLLKAKIDTGARTSAIDVSHIEEMDDEHVRFDIAMDREHLDSRTTIEAPIVRKTKIKSSFGAAHHRYIVQTTVRLGPIEKSVELGLVSRKSMLCRMLIGRKALEGDFLVDSNRRYLMGSRKALLKAMRNREEQGQS